MAKKDDGRSIRIFIFIATLIIIGVLIKQHDRLDQLTELGYLGTFLINFIASSTVLFPLPGVVTVLFGGAIWNPILVGFFSGLGATLGEALGYFLGYGSRGFLKSYEKRTKWIGKVEEFFHKQGFITIFIFSLIPLPVFDIIGIIAGAFNYPLWKFALATLLGRVLRNILIAWSGAKILPY